MSSSTPVVTLLGRSMGRPIARDKMPCSSTQGGEAGQAAAHIRMWLCSLRHRLL